MRVEKSAQSLAIRLGVTTLALATSPVLLLFGGPLRRRYLLHVRRNDSRALLCKEEGWVRPAYFVVTNSALRLICWPTEQLLRRLAQPDGSPHLH
ncbi:hypothetical protein [Streptomyces wuyuanensis]|uniref:hypothetical protein n=1 Tax=Streptomyces wuyuanensis TaxID=1196353 RepID=UPI003435708B